MIKYRTRWDKIEALEVVRETEKQVVLASARGSEYREAKRSDWSNWHDTWEEAHAFLISNSEKYVADIKYKLKKAEEDLAKVQAMKPPVTKK